MLIADLHENNRICKEGATVMRKAVRLFPSVIISYVRCVEFVSVMTTPYPQKLQPPFATGGSFGTMIIRFGIAYVPFFSLFLGCKATTKRIRASYVRYNFPLLHTLNGSTICTAMNRPLLLLTINCCIPRRSNQHAQQLYPGHGLWPLDTPIPFDQVIRSLS